MKLCCTVSDTKANSLKAVEGSAGQPVWLRFVLVGSVLVVI